VAQSEEKSILKSDQNERFVRNPYPDAILTANLTLYRNEAFVGGPGSKRPPRPIQLSDFTIAR
jgi:hypothetical protein